MESLCTRCTRLTVRPNAVAARIDLVQRAAFRSFSTTTFHCEDAPAQTPSSRTSTQSATQRTTRQAKAGSEGREPGQLVIRRQYVDARSGPAQQQRAPPADRLLTRRTGSSSNAYGQGSSEQGRPQQGQLLRRAGPYTPRQPGQLLRRSGPPRTAGAPGQGGNNRPFQPRKRRPADRQRKTENVSNLPTEEEMDEYVTKYIDRPANPTEQITYNPIPQATSDLQKDWPDTPLSATGVTASLVQKIEWLARRIPHGYQTSGQLAAHLQKGYLTRFESEEEKELVIKAAQDLAKKRAALLTERKGETVAAEDMTLADLSTKSEDRNLLVNQLVKGEYPSLEKQKMPFLDSIVRTLRNNHTYGTAEADKFMNKIQSMMPAQAARRAAPPRKAA